MEYTKEYRKQFGTKLNHSKVYLFQEEPNITCYKSYDKNENLVEEEYRSVYNNKLHRNSDLPCKIVFVNNNKEYEEYRKYGKLHRDSDLPSEIHYYDNGKKKLEKYYINGIISRHIKNGPAIIFYDEDQNIIEKRYIFQR